MFDWAGDGAAGGTNALAGRTPDIVVSNYEDGVSPSGMTDGNFTHTNIDNFGNSLDSAFAIDAGAPVTVDHIIYWSSTQYGGDGGSGVFIPDVDFYTSPDNVTYTLRGSVSHTAVTITSPANKLDLSIAPVTARYFKFYCHTRGQWIKHAQAQALVVGAPAVPTFASIAAGKQAELEISSVDNTTDACAGGIVICREV